MQTFLRILDTRGDFIYRLTFKIYKSCRKTYIKRIESFHVLIEYKLKSRMTFTLKYKKENVMF